MSLPDPVGVTVAVAPTSTTVLSVDVRGELRVSVQIDNLDAAQTFSGTVERRVAGAGNWSPSSLGDFSSIAALGSVTADLDVAGSADLRIVGTMSGAGGDVRVFIRRGVSL